MAKKRINAEEEEKKNKTGKRESQISNEIEERRGMQMTGLKINTDADKGRKLKLTRGYLT